MTPRRDNLVLFGIDSLRADRVSAYGYHRATTPHIDRLASQGVLFERCYSPHIPTTSAYASMLTGLDCFSHGIVALRHQGGLPDEVTTLAEALRAEGYQTVCVGFDGNPANRGFDRYFAYPCWADWTDRPCRKAENLNAVALAELERLAASGQPFFLFMRHMDPHSPYLPPEPFSSLFYQRDPCDPAVESMREPLAFRPFADYFRTWLPPGTTDADFVLAQYDGAIAYMDACIQQVLTRLDELRLTERTLVVLNGDHGETLNEHDCWFDHHGLYETNLHVPLILRHPSLPAGRRVSGAVQHQDLMPTVLDLLGIQNRPPLDGSSMLPVIAGELSATHSELYLTECTWMRKHGWRTPEWKLILALEPDFHFKPPVELYHLASDPNERENVAESRPEIVAELRGRLEAWIAQRTATTGRPNPLEANLNWHGCAGHQGPFTSSQQAYDHLYVPDPATAARLQGGSTAAPKDVARRLLGGAGSPLYRRLAAAWRAYRGSA